MTDDPRPGFNALRDKMLQHLEVHRAAKLEDLAQAAATFAYDALYLPGSPNVPHVQRTAPRRIYLCVSDDLDDRDEPFPEEVTWAADEAVHVTVPYVRADLANAGTAVAGKTLSPITQADIDRIVPALDPVGEEFPAEWALWKDRERIRAELAALAAPKAEAPEFTDMARAALLWVLWHHQGASSTVGQAMRFALGMGAHDRLDEHQVSEAKRWTDLAPTSPAPQEES